MSTTPPPTDPLSLKIRGTPVKLLSSTTSQFSSEFEERTTTLTHLGREMRPFVVGPITPAIFLERFLPPSDTRHRFKKGMFGEFIKLISDKEIGSYNEFIQIVSPIMENFDIFNTSSATNQTSIGKFIFHTRPDCSVYKKGTIKKGLDASLVDFFIEFKKGASYDPFNEQAPDSDATENTFVNVNSLRIETLGQLTAYATSMLGSQYRTHTFMIFIAGDYARLIRWDRAGAVVTDPILFNEEPHLFDFLIRYNTADDTARGFDVSVSPATREEISDAKDTVPELKQLGSFLAITIPGLDNHYSARRFIIPSPSPRPDIPVGRWTRASFAFDVGEKRRVLLKDSWRVSLPGILPEGVVYRRLHEGAVPNIPHCSLAGDVGSHRSFTEEIKDHFFENHACWKLTPHWHYRIVLSAIGTELKDFRRTRDFVQAMFAALKAHKSAVHCRILHRDISPGNILIFGNKEKTGDPSESNIDGGMLIDWDLSKTMGNDNARQDSRTGTWQFIAGDIIQCPDIEHKPAHDIESFVWVLLWVVTTLVNNNWNDSQRSNLILRVMKPKVIGMSGGSGKVGFLLEEALRPEGPLKRLAVRNNTPLTNLVTDAVNIAADRFQNQGTGLMGTHEAMLNAFKEALHPECVWPDSDKAVTQTILKTAQEEWFASRSASTSLVKRSSSVAVDPSLFIKRRR